MTRQTHSNDYYTINQRWMAKLGQIVVTIGQEMVLHMLLCEQREEFSLIVCILDTVGRCGNWGNVTVHRI